MTKPKKPTKPNAIKNREIVGVNPEAKSRRAARGAKRTSTPDEKAPPKPRKVQAAPSRPRSAAEAGANFINGSTGG